MPGWVKRRPMITDRTARPCRPKRPYPRAREWRQPGSTRSHSSDRISARATGGCRADRDPVVLRWRHEEPCPDWCAAVAVLVLVIARRTGGSREIPFPDPAVDAPLATSPAEETLVVAGGCFWVGQAVFQHVKGVTAATSGYAGGTAKTARYDIVSSGSTGHAESVRVAFDRSQVTPGQLLKIFFAVAHDPTELNGRSPTKARSTGPSFFSRTTRRRTSPRHTWRS